MAKKHKEKDYWETPCDGCTEFNVPYMVTDKVWKKVSRNFKDRFLCLFCVEKRLGRVLELTDFIDAWINQGVFGFYQEDWVNFRKVIRRE